MREPKHFLVMMARESRWYQYVHRKAAVRCLREFRGDQQMLEWTQAGDGARLMMLVHHDDAAREYAYGPGGGLPDTQVGTFSDALLAQANKSGWNVISMKNDWKRVYPFEK